MPCCAYGNFAGVHPPVLPCSLPLFFSSFPLSLSSLDSKALSCFCSVRQYSFLRHALLCSAQRGRSNEHHSAFSSRFASLPSLLCRFRSRLGGVAGYCYEQIPSRVYRAGRATNKSHRFLSSKTRMGVKRKNSLNRRLS